VIIAGVDEAGRGPLAGPVVAAAVILHEPLQGLDDSKKLSTKARERLYDIIYAKAKAVAIGVATHEEIDRINILQASLLAMSRAVEALPIQPDKILVDGPHCPLVDERIEKEGIINGDALVPAISAASIIAKVWRDREMQKLDLLYPGYGFAKHNGYGTALHLEAIARLGVTPLHRRSFAPVRKYLSFCQ
jgi:ribonuclease HII